MLVIGDLRKRLRGHRDCDLYQECASLLDQISVEERALSGLVEKRVAFLGGYNTSLLTPLVRTALFTKGVFVDSFESDYGVLETLIRSEDLALKTFCPDVICFCVGTEHLDFLDLHRESERWINLWNQARVYFGADVVQNTFEEPLARVFGNFEIKARLSRTRYVRELNLQLADAAPPYVHFHDVDALAALVGRGAFRDEKYYDLAKVPTSERFLMEYAENLSSVIAAIFGKSKKCLVLDLDNTLWGGVVGDDGIAGIEIGPGSATGEAFERFQKYLKSLKQRGVVLSVCSKNEEAIAREVFSKRPEMILKLEDFSAFLANWESKDRNLARISEIVNLGLDSMVFVDDSPAEREWIRQSHPEVEVIELPNDPACFASCLSQKNLFEITSFTTEDVLRSQQPEMEERRNQLRATAENYEGYLRELQMKAIISPFDKDHIPRITQLINKTNQFNLTSRRYTQSQVAEITTGDDFFTRFLKLSDRFGDQGLVSVFIAKEIESRVFEIDTWLMSCRVFKRGVERLFFREIVRQLDGRADRLIGCFIPTARNTLVAGLFESLGFRLASKDSIGVSRWNLDFAAETVQRHFLQDLPFAIQNSP